jgi:pyruvate kinase
MILLQNKFDFYYYFDILIIESLFSHHLLMHQFNNSLTSIVATVGYSCASKERLKELAEAGANMLRLNFAHGIHNDHLLRINMIREIKEDCNLNLKIVQDLWGPQIRITSVENEGVELIAGDKLVLTVDEYLLGTSQKVGITYTSMYKDVTPGERILIDEGRLELKVLSVDPTTHDIITEVVYGGILKSKKGINMPGTKFSLPALTEKDHADLMFGLEHNVDWVALSFVRTAQDIIDLKKLIADVGKTTKVIAKIQKPQAIINIDQIIQAADGIMIARGSLGVELDGAMVPGLQEDIIKKCRLANKPAIVDGQVLDSMKDDPFPTRSEVADIHKAVQDGASAMMLDVTARGKYPIEAVETMAHTLETAEKYKNSNKI